MSRRLASELCDVETDDGLDGSSYKHNYSIHYDSAPNLFSYQPAPTSAGKNSSSPTTMIYENPIDESQNPSYSLRTKGANINVASYNPNTSVHVEHMSTYETVLDADQRRPTIQQKPRKAGASTASVSPPGANTHFRANHSRLWHAFNILTFVIACAALVIAAAKPGGLASSTSAPGSVAASSVSGLTSWQAQVETNATALATKISESMSGCFFFFFVFFLQKLPLANHTDLFCPS